MTEPEMSIAVPPPVEPITAVVGKPAGVAVTVQVAPRVQVCPFTVVAGLAKLPFGKAPVTPPFPVTPKFTAAKRALATVPLLMFDPFVVSVVAEAASPVICPDEMDFPVTVTVFVVVRTAAGASDVAPQPPTPSPTTKVLPVVTQPEAAPRLLWIQVPKAFTPGFGFTHNHSVGGLTVGTMRFSL